MLESILALLVAAQPACIPSDISQSEAQQLALAIVKERARHPDTADVEPSEMAYGLPDTWYFRGFSNEPPPGPGIYSNLIGWHAIDKRTAAIWDPVLDENKDVSPAIRREQLRLRNLHCLTGPLTHTFGE